LPGNVIRQTIASDDVHDQELVVFVFGLMRCAIDGSLGASISITFGLRFSV